MLSNRHRVFTAIFILAAATAAGAQTTQPAPRPAAEVEYVTEKGFRSRVFEIRHRDPATLVRVLNPLGSGFRGAIITSSSELRTITVRDFPENIATVEEAIKRLDVPEPARPGVEFHIHILIATNSGAPPAQYPAELNDVIKQLQNTVNYKNYHLMTSQVLRAREQGLSRVTSKGVAELKLRPDNPATNNPIFYDFSFERISLEAAASGRRVVQIGAFNFTMRVPIIVNQAQGTLQYETIGFTTPVSLREGEKVVVGTTSMEDKGIVVVLTASMME